MAQSTLPAPDAPWALQGNLLSPGVRRDIADLNRLFLGRALDPAQRTDHWFQLPGSAVERLATAPLEARERAALCPVALFELVLPAADLELTWRLEAVADGDVDGLELSRGETRRSFGLVALGVARRLAEGVPLSSRIAFGLLPACEARLSALSPCDAFRLASGRAWSVHAGPVMHGSGTCSPTLRPARAVKPCAGLTRPACVCSVSANASRAMRACCHGGGCVQRIDDRRAAEPTFLADTRCAHYPSLPSRSRSDAT